VSNLITFSGVMSTDGAAAVARFTAFSLDSAIDETLTSIRNRLGSGKPVNMIFQGAGLTDRLAELEALECLQVTNGGQPYATSAGAFAAVARAGELVKVTGMLLDGTSRSEVGIIVNLALQVRGGKHGQSIDFVFYPCSTLRFTSAATVLTDPDA